MAGRHKKKNNSLGKVTCRLCDKSFRRLSATHLASHGYTEQQYRITFQAPISADEVFPESSVPSIPHVSKRKFKELPPAPPQAEMTGLPQHLMSDVAAKIASNPEFVTALSSDVQDALMSGPARALLKQAALNAIVTRMELQAQSIKNLRDIDNELFQPWRMKTDNEGKALSNNALIKLRESASKELERSENALQKAMRVLLEEQRMANGVDDMGRPLERYSGKQEQIPIMAAMEKLPSGERELIRTLSAKLTMTIHDKFNERSQQEPEVIEVAPKKVEQTSKPDDTDTDF